MVTSKQTYDAFNNAGVLSYLAEKGEDIAEQKFQQNLELYPEKAWVEIQSVFRVRDLDRNEFLTFQYIIHTYDYFDAEQRFDDKGGIYSNPKAFGTKDQLGRPSQSRIETVENAHLIKFSPEAVDSLLTHFEYWTFDKNDTEQDYFKRKRITIYPEVRRLDKTKFFIARASIAPETVADKPINSVPNLDDFKYLPFDKLFFLANDTRRTKSAELTSEANADTIKILKEKGIKPSPVTF